ncbi:MAG: D-aminoacyl-tRNA deacylase [Phascolarctobacterium sp.]|uniref:D-aminoacyl-tRNA deacylase n=1 Tax=Phascolarctobacterium sp. TaxID=2049039 RepID=UPI0026DB2733|nr:D-aminoacyl-tRNA deacylase [Phascolarctobacterium sp.]MDO4922234.1 D-aminoacyl-tRNA deacylase [Phascolarctobacterium sp.]
MRAVVQRVDRASVTVDGQLTGKVERGLLVLLGVAEGDTEKDLHYIVDKVCGLRIFEDAAGKMNLSVQDIGGSLLAVSQFTLCGDCRKGKRPSFDKAAKPDIANAFYEQFVEQCRAKGLPVETGVFRAHMLVELVNNGPVTILLDSTKIL